MGKMRTVICLLRNDLRVHDNEVLLLIRDNYLTFNVCVQVLQWAHRNGDHIIPLFCFDPDHFKGTWHFNFPKTGQDTCETHTLGPRSYLTC